MSKRTVNLVRKCAGAVECKGFINLPAGEPYHFWSVTPTGWTKLIKPNPDPIRPIEMIDVSTIPDWAAMPQSEEEIIRIPNPGVMSDGIYYLVPIQIASFLRERNWLGIAWVMNPQEIPTNIKAQITEPELFAEIGKIELTFEVEDLSNFKGYWATFVLETLAELGCIVDLVEVGTINLHLQRQLELIGAA